MTRKSLVSAQLQQTDPDIGKTFTFKSLLSDHEQLMRNYDPKHNWGALNLLCLVGSFPRMLLTIRIGLAQSVFIFFFTGTSESWGQGGISPPTNYGQIICITCSIKMPILLKIFRPSAGFVFIFFSPLYISAQVHLH